MQKAFLIFLFILFLIGVGLTIYINESRADEIDLAEKELVSYIEYFHQNVSSKYAKKAKRLIQPLLKYSKKHNVDPLLMGCIFSFESSWRNFNGAAGEKGPGQVMPSKNNKRKIAGIWYDLTTIDGQIEAACAHMRESINECDKLNEVFTHYASGQCHTKKERIQKKMNKRMKYYLRMKEMFRFNNIIEDI